MNDPMANVGDVILIPGFKHEYVVERALMTGGGSCHNDSYPDAWHVEARRLTPEGNYDPKGRLIRFTQNTNCYSTVRNGVKIVRKMRRVFVKE